MNKFKGLRLGKGKADIRKIGAAVVATMLVVAMVIGLMPNETALAATKVSDYGTETKYTESLGDNASTEYSGRIWTDKSVYSDSVTFDLYTPEEETEQRTATVSKDDNSDFLVAFSALGTSQAISGQTQAPVDVVFVIDTSGSMQDDMSDTDSTNRIDNAVAALNDSIEKVMDMNDYTRVAVVAFSNTAQVLLPLGRYEQGTRTYQTGGGWWGGGQTETVKNYFSLQNNTLYTHVMPENSTTQTNNNRSVTGGTNIQMGIYTGLNVLASAAETTATINGTEVTRVPSLILLSDGAPTYSSDSPANNNDTNNWWAPANNNNDGPGGSPYAGNGMKALMTGAYMKEIVNKHYGLDTTVYTIGMGISGLDNYEQSGGGPGGGSQRYTGEQDLAYMTLDPATYWTADNNMAKAIKSAWETYTAGNSATIAVNSNDNYTFNHPTKGDIGTLDDDDTNINPLKDFVDDYYDADSAGEVTNVFDEIVSNISISAPQVPTEVKNPDAIDEDGYITYTDPIGEYMEVKDVKAISYAGIVFTKAEDMPNEKWYSSDFTKTENSGTYEFAAEVHSPIYGDQNIKDIKITVTEDADGNQTLTIKIPASVIPVRVNTVTLNADGTVKSHTNNGAYPVRVFYTVGLKADVTTEVNGEKIIDTSKLSAEYIEANTNEDGTINFYSNLYTGENKVTVLENGSEVERSAGNATVEFEPSHTNPFYYVQEDVAIYSDPECETQVSGELNDTTTYYYSMLYYHGTSVETEVVARTGAQLKKTDIIEKGGYLYRAKGSPRLNRILEFEGKKIDNNTKTAQDFYAPTFQYASGSTDPYEGKFVIYLGNNGVLSVAASGNLEISKEVVVPDGLTPTTTEFEFKVDFNNGAKLDGEFAYSVVNAEGTEVRTGTIVDGGTLKLQDGQKAVIRNLTQGTTYEVTEADAAGFAKEAIDATGTIAAGITRTVKFVNTYSAKPVTVGTSDGFQVSKTLDGRDWNADAFTFILESVDVSAPMPSGSTNGVKEITIREDAGEDYKWGEVISETFGEIVYDKPGTYVYTIAEKMPASSDYLPGMSYSGAIYRIEVVVVDNGTGQLVATTTMTRTNDDAGTRVDKVLEDGNKVASFTNTYSADSTAWTPVGTKHYEDLSGANPMTARMFQFKISTTNASAPMPTDREIITDAITGERYCIAYNIGTEIAYPQITFDDKHASSEGVTYTYEFSEVNTGKPGVTYDEITYTVTVTAYLDSTSDVVRLEVSYTKDSDNSTHTRVEFSNKYEPTPVTLQDETGTDIKGTKTLNGRAMRDDETYEFKLEALNDAAKEVLQAAKTTTVSGGADGVAEGFSFEGITFTKPGVYTFNVAETAGNAGGVTYDTHTAVVTVTVKDNNGKLEVESIAYNNGNDITDKVAFVNTYKAVFDDKDAVSLNGTKQLTGRSLRSGEFFFVVEPKNNAPVGARAVLSSAASDGTIQLLHEVTYEAAGTYEYWFYEQIPAEAIGDAEQPYTVNGVTYDRTVYKYVVTVSDDQKGHLSVTDTDLFKTTGTWDTKGVVTVDENSWGVELTGSAFVGNDDVVFTNEYNTTPATRDVPTFYKILSGYRATPLAANEFQFTMSVNATTKDGKAIPETGKSLSDYITLEGNVEDAENGILGTVGNKADTDSTDGINMGSIDFGTLVFHEAGTYTLTFEEVTGTVAGVTYSTEKLVAVFKVIDDGLGQLEAEMLSLQGNYTFTNEYKSQGILNLEISKVFTGRENNEWLDSDKFEFEVVILDPDTQAAVDAGQIKFPAGENGIQKVTLTKDKQSDESPKITIYKPGTYKFIVREVTGSIPGINYDPSRYEVEVTATDNSNGEIIVTTNITDNKITFTNVYDAKSTVLSGHDNLWVEKEFIGREGDKWLDTDVFTFTLAPVDNDETNGTGSISTKEAVDNKDVELPKDEQGNVVTTLEVTNANKAHAHFGAITFHQKGTYTFTVTEHASTKDYIEHDAKSVRTIIVNVTDDLGGNLVAELSQNSDSLKYTNRYTTEDAVLEGATNLKVEKVLTGRDWFDSDAFEFTLSAYDDITKKAVNPTDGEEATVILPTNASGITISKTDEGHTANFGNITFEEVGTYKFQIKETKGNAKNVTYDSHSSIITVVVTDDNEGALVATPSYSGKMVFENVYTPDPVTATLTGTKTLNGRTLKAGEFRFHIEVAAGTDNETPLPATRTIGNAANGSVTFPTMTYTKAGTYKYTISEIKGHLAGVTYDGATIEATVKVTYDSATGLLVPVVTYKKSTGGTAFEFVNTYTSEPTDSINISAVKTVTPSDGNSFAMQGKDFQFEMEPSAGNPKDDPIARALVENTEGGIVTLFTNVKYTQVGTYVYTVHEVGGNRAGITYDDSVYTITVEVTDNESVAKLSAKVTIEKAKDGTSKEVDHIEFDNGYNPKEATAVIHGHKELTGGHKKLEANEFAFELKAVDYEVNGNVVTEAKNTPMPNGAVNGVVTTKNTETGLIQFGIITYTNAGTYQYAVSEVKESKAGYTYAKDVHYVTVTVTDVDVTGASTGELKATVTGIMDDEGNPLVTFKNNYVPNPVKTTIQGMKTLTGRDMKAGEFEFEIKSVTQDAPMPKDEKGNVVTVATNVSDGLGSAFTFNSITYDKVGEYFYTIVEKNTGKGGVTYDVDTTYVAKVSVTDEGYDGQLDAEVTYYKEGKEVGAKEVVFMNSYKAAPTGVILGVTKKLTGRDMKAGEFKFEIKAVTEGAPMPKDADKNIVTIAANGIDGVVIFEEITFDKTGEYKYTLSELDTGKGGVTYDKTVYDVVITVTDDGEGHLAATTDDVKGIIFKNVYKAASTTAQISAIKKLEGRDLKAGEFRFVLEDEKGNKIYAVNTADGTILFDKITYSEAGTYVYTLYEEKGDAEYVTYDDKKYTVTVVVEDDLEGNLKVTSKHDAENFAFENVYDKPAVIGTGDATAIIPTIMLMVLSAGYILVSFVKARKRQ